MAAPTAGSKIRASAQPRPYLLSAACSSQLMQSTTTVTAITGATLTFTTVTANANVMITGVFWIVTATAGSGTAVGHCHVDGADQAAQALWALSTLSASGTVSQTWNVSLATPGSHTINLLGALSSASGVASFNPTDTNITALVLDY